MTSWRRTCTSSCTSTSRNRSGVQPAAAAGNAITGSRTPHVAGTGTSLERSSVTGRVTPASRAASCSASSAAGARQRSPDRAMLRSAMMPVTRRAAHTSGPGAPARAAEERAHQGLHGAALGFGLGHRRLVHVAHAVAIVAQVAFALEVAQHGPHGGVGRGIGEVAHHVAHRGAAEAIHHVHDLALAAAE